VGLDAFANESSVRCQNEVAFQTSPHKMKFISTSPHICAGTFDCVLLVGGIVRGPTCANGVADIALLSERAQRTLLRKDCIRQQDYQQRD
jgi:hypothetical protein